ncbi:MAG: Wzz/FepE/Etk N-terminal domain-containing protein [Clostridia bacterium]
MPLENEKAVIVADAPTMPQENEQEREIDLVELFFRLLDNLKYIVLAVVVGALAAGLITKFLITPEYESTAKLYVLNSSDSMLNLSDLQIGNYLTTDYQEVFKTWEVNEQVISNLNLNYSYEKLQKRLTVTNPTNTRILYITYKSESFDEAALIANEFADVARKYIASIMATETPSILSDALPNPQPISPSFTTNVLIGAMLGFLLAAGIITLIFIFDDKIKSSDDIVKHAGIPVLAVVPINAQLDGVSIERPKSKKETKRR